MSTKALRIARPAGRKWPLIWGFLIAAGGTAKTSSLTALATEASKRGYKVLVFDLDAQCNTSEIFNQAGDLIKGKKTVFDLLQNKATLDEVIVPARFRVGATDADEDFDPFEGLDIVPGSPDMKNADTFLSNTPESFYWFRDLLEEYEGDHDIIMIDFPASYGRMVLSAAMMFDENDEVLPAVLAGSKEAGAIPKLETELRTIRDNYRTRKNIPGRPTMKHIIVCGTPTPSHNEMDARLTVEELEADYGPLLLPYVRYSALAGTVFRHKCPIIELNPKSAPSEDYRKVATALGLERLRVVA